VIFYLLLLSFSEHLPLPPAYWTAALAVSPMMSLYSRSLLGTWNKSWLMGLVMFLTRKLDWYDRNRHKAGDAGIGDMEAKSGSAAL
jgi:inner membrane protein involved in colicin E2 resistance